MSVLKSFKPLEGEHLLSTYPEMAVSVAAGWHSRLNLFTGRSLTATALEQEQQSRLGRLALRGQMLSPGVVTGLEVAIQSAAQPLDHQFYIAAGMGLTVYGEDVVVPTAIEIAVKDLPVYAPSALLNPSPGNPTDTPPSPLGAGSLRRLADRTLADQPLGVLATSRTERPPIANRFPRVGILVLRPIVVMEAANVDPRDPCEDDPQNDAYEDQQWIDGCQLVLYLYPSEWLMLPEADSRWRNRLAYSIFRAERNNEPDQALPWEQVGVPIALVGFDTDWKPLFVDRHAVARTGGKPKRRRLLLREAGNPFLWQARMQQFAEQLAEMDLIATPMEQVVQSYRYLPPVGVLPRTAIDPRRGGNFFFPNGYTIQAMPIPLEQLDLIVQECASLVPFDTFTPDQVQVLVPVPQTWFEPRLLIEETVNSEFQRTLDRLINRRRDLLPRRAGLRSRWEALTQASTGDRANFPAAKNDPERLEIEETMPTTAVFQSNIVTGQHELTFTGASPTFEVQRGDRLVVYVYPDPQNPPLEIMLQWHDGNWDHRVFWGDDRIPLGTAGSNSRRGMGSLPLAGQWTRLEIPASLVGLEGRSLNGIGFTLFNGRAAWGNVGRVTADGSEEDILWFRDRLPAGAIATGNWQWLDVDAFLPTPEASPQIQWQTNGRELSPIAELRSTLRPLLPIDQDFVSLDALPTGVTLPTTPPNKFSYDATRKYLSVTGVMTEAEKTQLLSLSPNTAYRAAIEKLFTQSQNNDDLQELDELGLEQFTTLLEERVDQADDQINIGFLRVQTDIYRVRQLMLGNAAATRLAISPTLAAIAQGSTAVATQEQITAFYQELKKSKVLPKPTPSSQPRASVERRATIRDARASFTASTLIGQQLEVANIFQPEATGAFFVGNKQPTKDFVIAERVDVSEIIQQAPVVGKPNEVRTLSTSERIIAPKAPEARNYSVASKHDVVAGLASLKISLQGLEVPGVSAADNTPLKKYRDKSERDNILNTPEPAATSRPGGDAQEPDESLYFADGVKFIDQTVATLRLVEGRVQQYRTAIAACRRVLTILQSLTNQVNQRLADINRQLAETRHDISVARALLAEEQQRVQQINDRRDEIIRKHVPYLVFHRPRISNPLLNHPTHMLNPGATLLDDPIPACTQQTIPVPAQLGAMLDLMREAPVRWFVHLPILLDRLDRPELLLGSFQNAMRRVNLPLIASRLLEETAADTNQTGQSLMRVLRAQQQIVQRQRSQTLQLNLATIAATSWKQVRDRAEDVLSLEDLLAGGHGRTDVSQRVSQELNQIAQVATCLYDSFGDVLPAIRLEWVQRFSQYDAAANLRDLATLPRWGEIEFLQRRELQTLVDWLFRRVNPRYAEATALINDLVRVCLLLASHAPVKQIVAGRVVRETTVTSGSRIDLSITDLAPVRVGMQVMLYSPTNQVVAQGVVEDLGQGQVAARITQTVQASVALVANARAHFKM